MNFHKFLLLEEEWQKVGKMFASIITLVVLHLRFPLEWNFPTFPVPKDDVETGA